MIEGAIVEEATAAGNVTADDAVDSAEGAFPLWLIGAKEDEGGGANEGGKMRDRAIIGDEPITGGEEVEEGIALDLGDGFPE